MDIAYKFSITIIAATVPFLIAIIVALRPTSKPKRLDDYFLYERKLSSGDFLKTSIGYSMQVAAIFLFLQWTWAYGAVAVLVPVFWALGYFLMWLAVRKGLLDDFLVVSDSGEIRTIHGYVGKKVKRGRELAFIMALFTILGLGGTLVAEMDYVTHFVGESLGFGHQGLANYLMHLVILFFTVFYVLWGGYRAVVETDKFQVPLSYVSFALILFVIYYHLAQVGSVVDSRILISLALLIFIAVWWNRQRISRRESDYPIMRDRILLSIICIIGLLTLLFTFGEETSLPSSLSNYFKSNENFWGFGILGAISLSLANVIWQFVDISSLQRLQSVQFSKDEASDQFSEGSRSKVLTGLSAAGIEAAIVWVLAILLAFGLQFAGLTNLERMSNFFMGLSGALWLVLPIFVFAIVSFMISTIDGFISAISYVAYYDLLRQQGRGENQNHLLARITTFFSVFIIYALYIFLREGPAAEDIGAILYVVYAVQLSICFVILISLFYPKSLQTMASIFSILSGGIAAWWTATTPEPPLGWIPADSWYVIPPLAVFATSIVTYLSVLLLSFLGKKVLKRMPQKQGT